MLMLARDLLTLCKDNCTFLSNDGAVIRSCLDSITTGRIPARVINMQMCPLEMNSTDVMNGNQKLALSPPGSWFYSGLVQPRWSQCRLVHVSIANISIQQSSSFAVEK